MTRRTIDAALLLLIAAHAHHIAVLAARYLEARQAARLTACDIDRLIDDIEAAQTEVTAP